MSDMTEKEMQAATMATLYELRLIISTGDKEQYTREELLDILDKFALAKDLK